MYVPDIAGTYDSTWHLGILYKLTKLVVRGKVLVWISNFLKNRTIKVFLERKESEPTEINVRVPQCSAISPLLVLTLMSDLSDPETRQCSNITFIDDIAAFDVQLTTNSQQQPSNLT